MQHLDSYQEFIALVLGFGIISIAAVRIAPKFQKLRLPILTGFISTGIVCGPYLLGLIPMQSITQLNFINEMALAFIAFAAGSELYFKELRSSIQSIKWNTAGQLFLTFGLGSTLVFVVSDYIPYIQDFNTATKFGSAILTGAIFVARSPASAIAVINEVRAKGPFTKTVMGVTVLIDFVVIILFSVCFALTQALTSGTALDYTSILIPIAELLASFLVGIGLGKILQYVLSIRFRIEYKSIVLILAGYSIYLFNELLMTYTSGWNHSFRLEPLIVCIIASLFITNYSKHKAEFLSIIKLSSPLVYAAFFTLTGASLNIFAIAEVWLIALIFFAIRMITMVAGSYFGGIMAKDPLKYIHIAWMPYLTQAGVALGLTALVANEFPEWGSEFATVIIAIIIFNQMIGPPLFKYYLTKVGENRNKGSFQPDRIKDAIIFGFENQAVSLSNELISKGWEVQILTLKEKGSFVEPDEIAIRYISSIDIDQITAFGIVNTEAIVCLLSDEENLQICEMAYQNFGTPDLIVRLNKRYNFDKFHDLGARIVDPSTAIVSLMDHFVRSPQATSLLLGLEKGKDSRDIEVTNRSLHGLTLRDLRLPNDVIILSVHRKGQMIISHGYTRLRLGDIVTFVGSNKSLDELLLRF